MCDKAVDDFPPTLNFVLDWFVTSRMIKKLLLLSMQIKVYFNQDSGNAVFNYNEMGVLNIDLNYIKREDKNFNEDDSGTIIHVRVLACHIKLKKT